MIPLKRLNGQRLIGGLLQSMQMEHRGIGILPSPGKCLISLRSSKGLLLKSDWISV